MKSRILFSFIIGLSILSISNAKGISNHAHIDRDAIQQRAFNIIHSVPASQDTITIPAGQEGLFEATINSDTIPGARINPMRVYKLEAGGQYKQDAGLNVINPVGVLTIVGAPGGTKPVILPQTVDGVQCGMNLVEGSIRLRNLYWLGQLSDGSFNYYNFVGSTNGVHAQFVDCDNCVFEFIEIATFSCNGYTNGAKLRFTNCYFRDLQNGIQRWGGRVFDCMQYIDTVWVENCTVTDSEPIFLQQFALCKFAYYNHNTIINSTSAWQFGVYYLEGYWVNNLFINQNWVGEDSYNEVTFSAEDPENGMFMSTIDIDSIVMQPSTKNHIKIQPEFMNSDSTINANLCGNSKIKAFASNNILWTDTVMMKPYYKNMQVGNYGPYGTRFIDTCPASYLTFDALIHPGHEPPWPVVNIPNIWMNVRTLGFFSNPAYPNIFEVGNYVNVSVQTVTPAIKDAATADQMAKWNASMYGVPGFANNITQSAFIFGDFNPKTIPGYDANGNKTEDGNGIAKFTDFQESFAQTGLIKLSSIDGLPIGALIWNDAQLAAYNSANEYAMVMAAYSHPMPPPISVGKTTLTPFQFALNQNYPDPFNPTTKISYSIPASGLVTMKVYNILGQEVQTLFSGIKNAGNYEATFDGTKLASGVYFYRLQAGNQMLVKKMLMLK